MIEMKLDTIYFDYIQSKVKLYETRVYDKKRQEIKLLDVVKFKDTGSNRTFMGKITELSYCKTFKKAIEDVGIKKILPNARSLKEGIKIYESFPHGEGGTYKDVAKKYGVLRMKFELLK
jgi:ASC-1-like (ASCH) protein